MEIDIDKLTEKELVELNHKIVARLRFLNEMRTHSHMLKFNLGEHVFFQPEGRPEIFGMITKYNKKTITVITEDGQHWNVSPMLLKKAKTKEQYRNKSKSGNVIELKQS